MVGNFGRPLQSSVSASVSGWLNRPKCQGVGVSGTLSTWRIMEAQAKEIRTAKQRGSVSFDRRFDAQDFAVKLDLCFRL